jgi:peroxiredoxin/tetratricopeptide (TPR) repeat protein
MSFIENPARWIMIFLALALGALAYWMSWALDRIEVAIVEKKHGTAAAAHTVGPVPTTMRRLSPAAWQEGSRFLRPATDEEAFLHGPFEKENLGGAEEAGRSLPFTSSVPSVAILMRAGTNALHTFDLPRAERCFRTAASEDAQCAGAWLGLAIASETRPGRAGYFLDKAEAATGKSPLELSWITAYRSFFSSAENGELAGRFSALAGAFDSIASAQEQDPTARLFAIRYRILAHHLTDAAMPDVAATDALLNALANDVGVQQVAHYGVLLWLKTDARRALEYAHQLFPEAPVTRRLAAAPREALGEWNVANPLLSASGGSTNNPEEFENTRILAWALYHQGNPDAALKLADELRSLPRQPRFTPDQQPDPDQGDLFIEARRLRAQLMMAAGKWEDLARSDALTALDEAGCKLASAQTHYWRAIAYAAQGFAQNANNQLDELRQVTGEISGDTALDRHRALAEGMTRGAEAFIELASGHVSPYVGDIIDVPAVALAPFLAKAGDRTQAQQLLEKDLLNQPASKPLIAMLQAAKDGKPIVTPTGTAAGDPGPSMVLANNPQPAPGFTLPDETGSTVGMEKWAGQPVLIIFQAGGARAEDAGPLKELRTHAPSFAHFGIPIVVVSTEEASMLLEALGLTGTPSPKLPFNMLSDRQQFAFKSWGCYDNYLDKPVHGAFLVDRQGNILWSNISHQSCVRPEYLLLESQRLLALQKEKENPPADQGNPATPTQGAGAEAALPPAAPAPADAAAPASAPIPTPTDAPKSN